MCIEKRDARQPHSVGVLCVLTVYRAALQNKDLVFPVWAICVRVLFHVINISPLQG